MLTIDDLNFDPIYATASYRTLLLYQTQGVCLAIPIPDAQPINFVEKFNNVSQCQDKMLELNRHILTLFSYSDNIRTWYAMFGDTVPHNLKEIQIFCTSEEDMEYIKTWVRRLAPRRTEAFVYDALNWRLLHYGIQYLEKIEREFNGQLKETIRNHRILLTHTLAQYFGGL